MTPAELANGEDMPIAFYPEPGRILICDFDGFVEPEMVKRRPVVVISPTFKHRQGLCTVVPLSTTAPDVEMPYHMPIRLLPDLPPPYDSPSKWVKADMIVAVAFHRLFQPFEKRADGRKVNVKRLVDAATLARIRRCAAASIGL